MEATIAASLRPDVVHQIVRGFGPVDNEVVEQGERNAAAGALSRDRLIWGRPFVG